MGKAQQSSENFHVENGETTIEIMHMFQVPSETIEAATVPTKTSSKRERCPSVVVVVVVVFIQ